jgi:asparagine synthase (glutamine-hydrolysing)
MCGIFSLLNYENHYTDQFIQEQFQKGKGRGPEHSVFTKVDKKAVFGFHRLAINGLTNESSQPIIRNNIQLICNGEIYNYKELFQLIGETPTTQSDCEIIVWLYEKYGIEQCLQMLDGVFAFILLDQRLEYNESRIYIARDPYGVRPLYSMHATKPTTDIIDDLPIGFASEMKSLIDFTKIHDKSLHYEIKHFQPGSYSHYTISNNVHAQWIFTHQYVYHRTGFCTSSTFTEEEIIRNIQRYITSAVEKRCCTTERPIACLLSGGLDSSLITSLVCEFHKKRGLPKIETYSIGLQGSVDLKHARIVADYLGTQHTEIVLTEKDFCDAIPEVIQAIESYDTTSVRASIGNYLLGKYIAANSEAKVIFNGDGSDELLGGYIYLAKAPDAIEFDKECRRLLKDIHAFDVLRSDKSISSHGLEPRTPFLDRAWTQFYLSIQPEMRFKPDQIEKYWLRKAFNPIHYESFDGDALLPASVLWRKKEAFSDGVSANERSLYQILQEHALSVVDQDAHRNIYETHNPPKTAEQYYYRKIFETYYPRMGKIVPYFWMPKYVEAIDASARTLAHYSNKV